MDGLYDIKTSNDLYKKVVSDYKSFSQDPNDYKLFNLLTSLNHLREWIYPEGRKSYINIQKSAYTKEQRIHHQLYNDCNYKIINKLCNNLKHFNDKEGIGEETEKLNGPVCGIATCGDRLGQQYYLVDGKDLRNIIREVFVIYKEFFEK